MNNRIERRAGFVKNVVRTAWIVGILGLTLPPIINADITTRVINQVFTGKTMVCNEGITPSNKKGMPSDVIVVFGAGDIESSKSLEEERLLAALLLYKNKQAPQIALLDGYTGQGSRPSQSKIRIQEMAQTLPGGPIEIEGSDIIQVTDLLNTAESAKEVKALMELHHWNKGVAVTNKIHILRALSLLCANGVPVSGSSVEDIVLQWMPYIINDSKDQVMSPETKSRLNKELIGVLDVIYTRGEGSILLKYLNRGDYSGISLNTNRISDPVIEHISVKPPILDPYNNKVKSLRKSGRIY
jgi:uncharacterized SAM-binding protein YcdF (DUF218 family)